MGNISTGRIHETALWVDFEGGHAKHILWDAAMVVDSPNHCLKAIRFAMRTDSKASNSKLKNSLPKNVFDSMRLSQCCVINYEKNNDRWEVTAFKNTKKPISEVFAGYIPEDTQYILAWNMKGHDSKILAKIVPKPLLMTYTLLDPLVWFRKHFSLPSNSLGKSGPGTPRAAMKAGDYSYLGKSHTSFVDTLHMRDVTLNAAVELSTHNQTIEPGFRTIHDTFIKPRNKKEQSNCTKDGSSDWMWDDKYWDKNKKLVKSHSKEFKRKLIVHLKEQGRELTSSDRSAINATQKQATFKKYLTPI